MPRLVLEVLRYDTLVAMRVLEQDEELRDYSDCIAEVGGLTLQANFGPLLTETAVWIRGADANADRKWNVLSFDFPAGAESYVNKIKALVRKVNEGASPEPATGVPVVERVE